MRSDRRVLLTVAVYLGTFMALLDVSIVNVALPTLQSALQTNLAGLQWIGDGYVLCMSSFMLSAGAVSDRFGRKSSWLIGVAAFMLGSAICAAAQGLPMMLVGRIVQGTATAFIVTGALSLIAQAFPENRERAHAIAGWAAFSTFSFVVGPVAGGMLIDALGWPSIFLINIPVGLVTLALGALSIAESADPGDAPVDIAGQILSVFWLGALVFGLIAGGAEGWRSVSCIAALACAAAGLVAFLAVESRAARPILPLGIFANAEFAATSLASFAIGFSAFSSIFLYSIFLQNVLDASPTATGARMVPIFVAQVAFSILSGRLTARFGHFWTMVSGYVLIGLPMVALGAFGATAGYATIAALFALQGVGMGLAIPATSNAAMALAPRERTGMASAIVNATRQTGTAVGIALLGALMSSGAIALLGAKLAQAGLPGAEAIARGAVSRHEFAGSAMDPETLRQMFGEALTGGFRVAVIVAGTAALVSAGVLMIVRYRAGMMAEQAATSIAARAAQGSEG